MTVILGLMACTQFDIRLGEIVELVDEEFRYAGETRHRQRQQKRHTAFCLACGWNAVEALIMDAKAKAKAHVAAPELAPGSSEAPLALGEGVGPGLPHADGTEG